MIEYIFVSIMCIGASCDFMISQTPLPYAKCQEVKSQFFRLPFKPNVTLTAAQCMQINTGEKV